MTIKDRILTFLEARGIKKAEFFELTGIQPSNFKGKNMQSQPGGDMLVKVLTTYPELSAEWIMRGEGDMIRRSEGAAATVRECSSNCSGGVQKEGKSRSNGVQTPSDSIIMQLLEKITGQAEEIGRLKQALSEANDRADEAERRANQT